MRVMTFNLRFENEDDGGNAWVYRREMAVAIINRYQPDILGTQEGKWAQINYLSEQLTDYTPFLPGREPDPVIQCPTLFFRKQAVTIICGGEFWLSETPDVHLSKSWDSAFPRMMSWAEVRLADSASPIITAVTHLDHMGPVARLEQAKIIARWSARQTAPIVLMGDFNDAPGSPAHALLAGPRLRDTWWTAGNDDGPQSFTRHRFDGIPLIARLDWILAAPCFQVRDVRIVHDHLHGRYPSDHFPYIADIDY
ncbi:MAG: endonuclease/exonuclease/phosphatase family protein [Desulfobacteraceae bacterium]|nr:endonuclease/exonuclease/phosphatase family protein [Desulfobacteraceae bacterium]